MAGGKPKNDGQLLQIRVELEAHAAISEVLAVWAKLGYLPSRRTKAAVVEEAVKRYRDVMVEAVQTGTDAGSVPGTGAGGTDGV